MNEHVDTMDSIEKLEKAGYKGPNACLMISLFEYGLAWKKEKDEILFIYGIGMSGANCDYNRFDRCTLTLPINPAEEWDWADWDSVGDFADYNHLGVDARIERVVQDLMSYYGYENVFGSSYWEGFSIKA